MPELIDRKHAEQAVEAYLCSRCEMNGNEVCHNCPHLDGAKILRSVPTIEAEPVRQGLWIEAAKHRDENGTILTDYECSECFAMLKDSSPEEIKDERFCYNCGADMRTADTKD